MLCNFFKVNHILKFKIVLFSSFFFHDSNYFLNCTSILNVFGLIKGGGVEGAGDGGGGEGWVLARALR